MCDALGEPLMPTENMTGYQRGRDERARAGWALYGVVQLSISPL